MSGGVPIVDTLRLLGERGQVKRNHLSNLHGYQGYGGVKSSALFSRQRMVHSGRVVGAVSASQYWGVLLDT